MVLTGWKKRKRHHARGVAFSALGMVALVGAGLAPASTAQGAIIEHTFSGVLSQLDALPAPPWDDATLDSTFIVRYWFDTEAEDLAPTDDDIGRYDVLALTVAIDGDALFAGTAQIEIFDNPFGIDDYRVSFFDLPFPGGSGSVFLSGFDALSGDDLLADMELGMWSGATVFGVQFGTIVNGGITEFSWRIVPAPAASWTILISMSVTGRRRRRRTSP